MIPCETVPCETCGTPTPFTGTRRCNNCWEVERRLPDYTKSPKAWDFVRQHIPKLDDWVDGHPDAWDYDAVLRENEVIVEWCDTLVDGNGNEHRAGEFAGWGFSLEARSHPHWPVQRADRPQGRRLVREPVAAGRVGELLRQDHVGR